MGAASFALDTNLRIPSKLLPLPCRLMMVIALTLVPLRGFFIVTSFLQTCHRALGSSETRFPAPCRSGSAAQRQSVGPRAPGSRDRPSLSHTLDGAEGATKGFVPRVPRPAVNTSHRVLPGAGGGRRAKEGLLSGRGG